jgi:uncharacterized membrane protein YbhN (UPF0104 family)
MRSAWLKVVIAVLAIAALAALAYRSHNAIHLANFSWSRLGDELAGTRKGFLVAALGAVYLAYLVRAIRWKRFTIYLGPSSLLDVWTGTMMGFAAMFVLGRPAEPIRPLLLARKCRIAVSSEFGIYVLERLFDTAAAAVLAGFSLLLFRNELADGTAGGWVGRIRGAGGALLAGLLIFGLLLLYFRMYGAGFLERRLSGWRSAGGWRAFVATQLAGFGDGLQAIRSLSDWGAAVAYSTVHWGLIVFVYLWVFRSFGGALGELNFSSAMLVVALTMLGSLVQLPGVGGGAQLASFIALTRLFHIDAEPAAAVAVITWLISFAGVCFIGLPLLVHEGLSMGDLRRLAGAEAKAEWAGEHVNRQSAEHVVSRRGLRGEDGKR